MKKIPPVFDPDFYRMIHPDLAQMDERQLLEHYEIHGRGEGRAASPAARRADFVDIFSSCSSLLEIGPFCAPTLKGPNVHYFDVLDSKALRQRAKELGYPIKLVPHVDYVDPNGDLSVIGRRFAAVFSAHCIEHQPDLIRHLQQIESLLEPGGAYFLAIPDKRYCFDHFIALSSISDVVQAHEERRRNHTIASVIEHRALTTHNNPARHWSGDHADPGFENRIPVRVSQAIEEYRKAQGAYVDVHAWQFTPESFKRICEQLFALGYVRLWPARVYDTPHGSNEFTAILEART